MMNKKLILGVIAFAIVLVVAVSLGISRNGKVLAVQATQVVDLKDGDTYTLIASYVTKEIQGKEQKMLAYNGMIPGPTIRVGEGAEVTIDFKNDTDLPTALHSHGIRMDNQFDGAVPTSQQEIPPGGSFTYQLKFPDAGVYWYHPHVNEVYEQALGLYGAYVVTPKDADYYPPANSEHVLMLSDLPFENGAIAIEKDGKDRALMGHFGNVMLVNGEENYTLAVKKGEVVQLDIINAANTRPFNFAIAGAKLKVIGSDSGAYERATWADSVVLGPSERAIVQVMFPDTGTYQIQNKTPKKTYALGQITVGADVAQPSYGAQFNQFQENRVVASSIDPFRKYFDPRYAGGFGEASKPVDKKLVLSVDFSGMMAGHMGSMPARQSHGGGGGGMSSDDSSGLPAEASAQAGIEWDENQMMAMMKAMATADETKWKITDAATGKSNMDIEWTFTRGEPVKIQIFNDPKSGHPMQHPIHFHGQRFLVLSINGVRQTNLVWKDTVLVPAGSTVEILLDPSNTGVWMAHCHIAEHLEAGMMFTYRVE